MDPWLIVVAVAALAALVWWLFRPSAKAEPRAPRAASGSVTRLAERGLEALPLGLRLSPRDDAVAERFDFPPFGRGAERAATEVVRGTVDGVEVLAFRYSFVLEGEDSPRQYDITALGTRFPWTGRLRLASLPREPGVTPGFADAWRVDEEPPGLDLITERLREILMDARLKASAVVVQPDAVVLVDTVRRTPPDLVEDLMLLKSIRDALRAA